MKKQILILGHSYASQFLEGYNQYSQLFDRSQFEVTVVYLVGEDSPAIRQQTLADHIIFLDLPRKAIGGLKLGVIQLMLKLCREKKFTMVFCNRYKPTYIMLIVSIFCKIPLMFSIMHAMKTMHSWHRKILIYLRGHKNLFFVGVSGAVSRDLQQDLQRVTSNKVLTLHNMIDVHATQENFLSRQCAREFLKIPEDIFLFGNAGRLVPAKDQASLIKAFAAIKPHCPKAKLMIMGSGQLQKELEELVSSLNLSDDVILTGFIPNGIQYLKAFDVFVSSAIEEAFGRVVLEAMVANVPVIATAVDGVPEVLGDTGCLLPSKNNAALSECMENFYKLSKEELTRIGNNGHERACREFSFEKFSEVFWKLPTISIYQKNILERLPPSGEGVLIYFFGFNTGLL